MSNDEVRGGTAYADGIGGGVKLEVNMPKPIERTGAGAWIVGGSPLRFRSSVSTSVFEKLSGLLLRVDADLRRPRETFSEA